MAYFKGAALSLVGLENTNTLEVTSSGLATLLRLSLTGHYEASGIFTSPVVDIGYVTTLAGINWDVSQYGNSLVSVEARVHTYGPPSVTNSGTIWHSGQLSSEDDPLWGSDGLDWIEVAQGGEPLCDLDCRFLQYRVLFTAGGA